MVDNPKALAYGKRFKSAMDERFKDMPAAQARHETAAHLEMTYQGVVKLAAGTVKEPGAYTNAKAAELFQVAPDWLALGEPYPRERGRFSASALTSRPAPAWPLEGVDEAKVRALDHDDSIRLSTAVLISAQQLGLDVALAKRPRRANSTQR